MPQNTERLHAGASRRQVSPGVTVAGGETRTQGDHWRQGSGQGFRAASHRGWGRVSRGPGVAGAGLSVSKGHAAPPRRRRGRTRTGAPGQATLSASSPRDKDPPSRLLSRGPNKSPSRTETRPEQGGSVIPKPKAASLLRARRRGATRHRPRDSAERPKTPRDEAAGTPRCRERVCIPVGAPMLLPLSLGPAGSQTQCMLEKPVLRPPRGSGHLRDSRSPVLAVVLQDPRED